MTSKSVATTLEESNDMVTGKQVTNRLADNYEDVSNIPANMKHQRDARDRNKERGRLSDDIG